MVVLRVYQDLPYAEIARIMGCAEGTVKATMFAAFGKLRTTLAPHAMGRPEQRQNGADR
jgi:DNA-directed RNA polymerase specialized sigma24 family protein